MKLAEAMNEKNRLKKEIAALREKLELAAQGKAAPEENPKKNLLKLEETLRRQEILAAAVYRTNDRILADGKSLTRVIYSRDTMFFRLELYKKLIALAGEAENPSLSGLSISELEGKAEKAKERIRHLSSLIQKINWTEDLMEE